MKYSPLHDLHVELGAKMGAFAGYEMPLWYPDKIISEHLHTRNGASLFDISHMGQIFISGSETATQLEQVIPTDLLALKANSMRYCCMTNENGGIIDDLIASRLGDKFFLVLNAATKDNDLEHLHRHLPNLNIERLDNQALLALQGPQAASVLGRFNQQVCQLSFMNLMQTNINGTPCIVSRSGYTGEDGFEISVPADDSVSFARTLLNQPEVKPAGLGARDSLRLEAALGLYGVDMNTRTTPVAAGIQWTISKSRRAGGKRAGGFPGDNVILRQIKDGAPEKLVGLRLEGRMPARSGAEIYTENDQLIGRITSGTKSPWLNEVIALGYVKSEHANLGNEVIVKVRKRNIMAKISKRPFVKHRYFYAN